MIFYCEKQNINLILDAKSVLTSELEVYGMMTPWIRVQHTLIIVTMTQI